MPGRAIPLAARRDEAWKRGLTGTAAVHDEQKHRMTAFYEVTFREEVALQLSDIARRTCSMSMPVRRPRAALRCPGGVAPVTNRSGKMKIVQRCLATRQRLANTAIGKIDRAELLFRTASIRRSPANE